MDNSAFRSLLSSGSSSHVPLDRSRSSIIPAKRSLSTTTTISKTTAFKPRNITQAPSPSVLVHKEYTNDDSVLALDIAAVAKRKEELRIASLQVNDDDFDSALQPQQEEQELSLAQRLAAKRAQVKEGSLLGKGFKKISAKDVEEDPVKPKKKKKKAKAASTKLEEKPSNPLVDVPEMVVRSDIVEAQTPQIATSISDPISQPHLEDSDSDIFSNAGSYKPAMSDDDDEADSREKNHAQASKTETFQKRDYFHRSVSRSPTPPPVVDAALVLQQKAAEMRKKQIEGASSNQRLEGLESGEIPSAKDLLEIDAALAAQEKRAERKALWRAKQGLALQEGAEEYIENNKSAFKKAKGSRNEGREMKRILELAEAKGKATT